MVLWGLSDFFLVFKLEPPESPEDVCYRAGDAAPEKSRQGLVPALHGCLCSDGLESEAYLAKAGSPIWEVAVEVSEGGLEKPWFTLKVSKMYVKAE